MKKYKVILADPPWKYDDELDNNPKYGGITYKTMDTEEICNLPIKELADNNCILFIWVTMPKLEDVFKVINAWGFKYRTCGFVWIKIDSNGKIRTGIGKYTNSNAELCLIARRGRLERKVTDIKQICLSKIREHSRKPDEIYSRIERLFGDVPRIELFARHRRQGWDVWGNEAPNFTQLSLPSADGDIIADKSKSAKIDITENIVVD